MDEIKQYLKHQDSSLVKSNSNSIKYRIEPKIDNGIDLVLSRYRNFNGKEKLYDELVLIPGQRLFYLRRGNQDKEPTYQLINTFFSCHVPKNEYTKHCEGHIEYFLKNLVYCKNSKPDIYNAIMKCLSYGAPIYKHTHYWYDFQEVIVDKEILWSYVSIIDNSPKILNYILKNSSNKYTKTIIKYISTLCSSNINYNDIVYFIDAVRNSDIEIIGDIPAPSTYDLNLRKLTDYITSDLYYQGIDTYSYSTSRVYEDYLNMGNEIQRKQGIIYDKYPKYLMTEHDIITRKYNIFKQLEEDLDISNVYNKYIDTLNYKFNEYEFTMPKSSNEILDEGRQLHHCVASYVNKYAEDRCILVFMRYRDINESLITIELDHDLKLVQARGLQNRFPNDGEETAINAWLNYIQNKHTELLVED